MKQTGHAYENDTLQMNHYEATKCRRGGAVLP